MSPASEHWLNRNVKAMSATSLLSDLSHEAATSILPGFLSVLGVPPVGLGAIEGIADALSSFIKLGSGWMTDRFGNRKPVVAAAYVITGLSQALFAVSHGFGLVLTGRTVGWFARGFRGPMRSAIFAESVSPAERGRAFGFHRAADTVGAVLGPLLAVGLLKWLSAGHVTDLAGPFRTVFLLSVIPGVASGAVFLIYVKEKHRERGTGLKFLPTLRGLGTTLGRGLWGIGLFGLGDFSHTLIILAGTQLLTPRHGPVEAAGLAGLLYVLHNVAYAVTPFPVGAISDRRGRGALLALGYALGAAMSLALGLLLMRGEATVATLAWIFVGAGVVIGIQDTMESALVADLTPVEVRGTAYGVLGTVNGIGDLVSSLMVGALWTLHPMWGFGYAGLMMLAGSAAILVKVRDRGSVTS